MKLFDPQATSDPFPTEALRWFARHYSGKLLLRSEIRLEDAVLHTLMMNGNMLQVPSMTRNFFHIACNRCGNRKRSLIGRIPCEICNQTHAYCRNCIQMGRVMECEPLYEWTGPEPEWEKHTAACTWCGELTPAQQHAANEITRAIQQTSTEILIWAVCGAGKTEMLFSGIEEALREGKRIAVATPRSDVVRELLPRMKEAFTSIHVQGLYGGSKDNDGTAQLIVSTTHQLFRYKNAFDVMIIDEVDAFPYHADPALGYATKRAVKQMHTTIYLTATPRAYYQHRIRTKKLACIFVPARYHGYPLPEPTFKMCFSLQKDLQKNQLPHAFFHWLQTRQSPQRQIMIFVPTIDKAEQLTRFLQHIRRKEKVLRAFHSIASVHAEDVDREDKIAQFRKKEIDMLVTTTIMERGVTFPSVDIAILDAGHHVFDEAALVQISGRAGRSASDPDGEVVFFHDGNTKAMLDARRSIRSMNRRGGFI